MTSPTRPTLAVSFDDDHRLHHFVGIGYSIDVAYHWQTGRWYTIGIDGTLAHPSQAAAIAHAANRILADVSAETGDPQEILEVRSADEWFVPATEFESSTTERLAAEAAERGTSVAELVATLAEAQR